MYFLAAQNLRFVVITVRILQHFKNKRRISMSLSNAMAGQNKGSVGQTWPAGPKLGGAAIILPTVEFQTKYTPRFT